MESSSKLNRDPQNEAYKCILRLEEFIKILEEADDRNDDEDVDVAEVLETLRWHLKISRIHYRNLLHCYAISERGPRKTTT